MASLFKRPKSPYWWLKSRNAKTGQIERESTRLRIGIGADTRAAQKLCAERSLDEVATRGLSHREFFAAWVHDFLNTKYAHHPHTLTRYLQAWANLKFFLDERHVTHPRQLARSHCTEFVAFRQRPNPALHAASHNTALHELQVLRLLMNEALARCYVDRNPVSRLGFSKTSVREKAELSDADLEFLESKIREVKNERQRTFLLHSFLIGKFQGCRLTETRVNPFTDIDLEAMTIKFLQKGNRLHITRLHPGLLPLIRELRAANKTETYRPYKSPSAIWAKFMKSIGWGGARCFHSLRVSVATRLARSGKVKELQAMKFIGHASTTIHRIYVRMKTEDLAACVDALK